MAISSGAYVPPLDGVVVIEAGAYFAAPFAAMMLADLGADVTKIEPPRGDPFRKYGLRHQGLGAAWVNANHGKRSVELDLRDPAGRARMEGLLEGADVFINNWRNGVASGLGLTPSLLAERHPRLIQLSLTGFGSSGPRRDEPAFDGVIQAVTGFASYEGRVSEGPRMSRAFIMDKTVASFATQAVLSALIQRSRTGRGTHLELSMLDVMAYFNFPDVGQERTFLSPDAVRDLPAGRSSMLRTTDGYVLAAPVTGSQIRAAFAAVGRPEWAEDVLSIRSPTELTDTMFDRLESMTATMTTSACEDRFRAADVPAAAVFDLDAHLADAQTAHNDTYFTDHVGSSPVRRVRYPLRVDGERLPPTAAAPTAAAASGAMPTASSAIETA